MKLSEIYDMIKKDFDWDSTSDIPTESAKSSKLFTKYIELYSNEKMKMGVMKNDLYRLRVKKRDYYSGNGTPEEYKQKPFNLRIKTEAGLERYINSDDDIIKLQEQIIVQEQKVEILTNCLEEVKRRGYAIRVTLDAQKFYSGE